MCPWRALPLRSVSAWVLLPRPDLLKGGRGRACTEPNRAVEKGRYWRPSPEKETGPRERFKDLAEVTQLEAVRWLIDVTPSPRYFQQHAVPRELG